MLQNFEIFPILERYGYLYVFHTTKIKHINVNISAAEGMTSHLKWRILSFRLETSYPSG